MTPQERASFTLSSTMVWLLLTLPTVAHATETVTYYYTDSLGTPLATTDASGTPTPVDYRPYGTQALGNVQITPAYTGQSYNVETGIIYMDARYYDPFIGRFLSIDPVAVDPGDIFQISRFAYANNNPIDNSDPTGMMSQDMNGLDGDCQATHECQSDHQFLSNRFKNERPTLGDDTSFANEGTEQDNSKPSKILSAEDVKNIKAVDLKGMTVFSVAAAMAGNAVPMGTPYRGTAVHVVFSVIIRAVLPPPYYTEKSYLRGVYLPFGYGFLGTSRADGIYGDLHHPQFAVDLKTGGAVVTPKQLRKYERNLPKGTRLYSITVPP